MCDDDMMMMMMMMRILVVMENEKTHRCMSEMHEDSSSFRGRMNGMLRPSLKSAVFPPNVWALLFGPSELLPEIPRHLGHFLPALLSLVHSLAVLRRAGSRVRVRKKHSFGCWRCCGRSHRSPVWCRGTRIFNHHQTIPACRRPPRTHVCRVPVPSQADAEWRGGSLAMARRSSGIRV